MLQTRFSRQAPPAPGLLSTITMTSILGFLTRRTETHVLTVELDREDDGRIIAEIPDLPGVMTYGATTDEAIQKAAALALRVFADRLESSEVQAKRDMSFQLHTRECLAGR
jgi:predicted RNase H-like HicB family nuclease